MTCPLLSTNWLPEPMMAHFQLDYRELISVEVQSKYNKLQKENGFVTSCGHFVSAFMFYLHLSCCHKYVLGNKFIIIQCSISQSKISMAVWIQIPICIYMTYLGHIITYQFDFKPRQVWTWSCMAITQQPGYIMFLPDTCGLVIKTLR